MPNEKFATGKTILMLGCFDTKAEDFNYLHSCLDDLGASVFSLNTGVKETNCDFPIDITALEVASQTNISFDQLRETEDRNIVIEKMGEGAAKLIAKLVAEDKINGVISMGGGGGTYIALSAMQSLPLGIPKLCLSTVATKNLSRQVGTKNITLMPSIVDVAGLNNISRLVIRQAAGAICGMTLAYQNDQEETHGTIAISIFGNTTICVEKCSELLKAEGYEVLAFHSVGSGGKAMESLVHEGLIDAVLDITTTELADELCEGICSAGSDRLTAASQIGIPQVVVPGCLDMVNYGHMDTVPEQYKSRLLYSWAPDVTLMRTNEQENKLLGKSMAEKVNKSTGKACFLLPLKGISKISNEGGVFYAPEIDRVLFAAIKEQVKTSIPVYEVEANINDDKFAQKAVDVLLEMIEKK